MTACCGREIADERSFQAAAVRSLIKNPRGLPVFGQYPIGELCSLSTLPARSLSALAPARCLGRYSPLIGFVIAGGLLLYESLLMGPPGTLTIFDLNQMLLPAAVSLLWAGMAPC
jgi:hypothetical protein